MKKIISLVLVLVFIFSMAVPSYASEIEPLAGDHNSELSALNDIDYWIYWIWSDFSGFFRDLIEDSDVIRQNLIDAVDFLNISQLNLSDISNYEFNILGELQKLNKNLFGETTWLTSFADSVVYSLSNISGGLQSLVNVFADPEDLKLRDNQENNLISATDNFFTPGNDTSISSDDISGFAGTVGDFFSAFDTSHIVGDGNPLDLIGEGSDFSKWFSTENGQSMDPNFGSGIGGGGVVSPPPESESPYQGTNLLPYAVSNLVTGTIYNGKGFKNYATFGSELFPDSDVYSDSYSVTGYIEVEPGDTLYFYNMNFLESKIIEYFASGRVINYYQGYDITDLLVDLYVDENGVLVWEIPSDSLDIIAVRFTSTLITSASIITKNVYPLKGVEPEEPESEPIKNWLPLATTEPGGTEIYNGIGYKLNTRWSNSSQAPVSFSNHSLSGWIPCSSSDIIYISNAVADNPTGYSVFYSNGSTYSPSFTSSAVDSNQVVSFIIPDNVSFFRVSCSWYLTDSFITINQYPIQESATASTYSLRSSVSVSAPEVTYSDEVVTSYYQDRMTEFYNLLGGGN